MASRSRTGRRRILTDSQLALALLFAALFSLFGPLEKLSFVLVVAAAVLLLMRK